MQTEQTLHNTQAAIPSGEEKARRFRTAMLKQSTIDHLLLNQEMAQSSFSSEKHTQESLSAKCFSAAFLEMRLNTEHDHNEPIFALREPNGTFFGYFYESALHLCL